MQKAKAFGFFHEKTPFDHKAFSAVNRRAELQAVTGKKRKKREALRNNSLQAFQFSQSIY